MKYHARIFLRLVSGLVLTFPISAQSTAPSGSFGLLINGSTGFAALGVMTFDGAGNVTGTITQKGANDMPARAGTFTGTYSSNPNGTGSVIDTGTTIVYATVTTDGGQGIQLVATGCSGAPCPIGATLISGVARAAQAVPLNGSYGFQLNNTPSPATTVGVMTFDGAGNAAVSFTSAAIDPTGSQLNVSSATFTGTYSTNPDGSGAINLAAGSGQAAGPTFAFVITDGGSQLLLLQTSPAGNGVLFGTARLQ